MISNSGTSTLGLYDLKRQIDAFGGVDYFRPNLAGGYLKNARVMLANGDIVKSTIVGNTNNPNVDMTGWVNALDASFFVDGDKNQHQINAEIAIKTRYANNIVVTPENFGADTSKADNSNEIQDAINFVVANGGWLDGGFKTYKAANLVIDSDTSMRNIYLENNVFDTNMVSVITTETADALRTPLTNVELINVRIDGKRSMLTGMPEGAFSEDGGRHGFRFVRPINGLVMRGCSANYCGVDGIMIFPIRDIPQSEWQHWVKNVEIDSCKFNWNGRHGGSIDSFDGVVVRNTKCLNNGLDLTVGAPLTSGAAGRKLEGALYGAGWDCEEYFGVAYSKNILFDNCTMLDNARQGLLFERTGVTTVPSSGIRILGGEYNKGLHPTEECSIRFGGYSISGASWYSADITDVDFKGGELLANHTQINSLTAKNILRVRAISSTVNSLIDVVVISSSSFIKVPAQNQVKPDGITQQQLLKMTNAPNSTAAMLFYDTVIELVRGAIEVESRTNVDSAMYFSVHGERRWMLLANGTLLPIQDAVSSIGYIENRVSTIYLATAPVVGSDIKYKKDIESISDVEREVALELKLCIKKYRLIDSDDKQHIGLIAQEVESVFAKHGLNAHEYKLLQYSADSETYALVYEQLMLFIISAM